MLKQRRFRILIVLLLLLVLALLAAAALLRGKRPGAAVPAAVPAQAAALEFLPGDLASAEIADLRETMALTGSLRALNQVTVKARVAGQVQQVLVREGEAVRAGQLLVQMDRSEYQARVDQAQGALVAARGQQDIAARTRDNNRALLARGFISPNANSTSTSQYEIALANVNSARGALDAARKALNDTAIHAPIDGLVSSRSVQPGEKVSPDNPLLNIVDLHQLELEAAVPAAEILRVALGQPVQVTVEGMAAVAGGAGRGLPGTVVRINPATQPGSRSIMVYIRVDNTDGRLRAGMFAEAQLTLAHKAGVLTVPQSALQTAAGQPSVYVVEDGVLAQKTVTVGVQGRTDAGPAVEITAGLKSGARVVKTNLGNLPIGARVRVLPGTSAASAATPAPAPRPSPSVASGAQVD